MAAEIFLKDDMLYRKLHRSEGDINTPLLSEGARIRLLTSQRFPREAETDPCARWEETAMKGMGRLKKQKRQVGLLMICGLMIMLCFSLAAAENTVTATYEVTYEYQKARDILDMINDFRTGDNAWIWNSDNETKTTYTDLGNMTYDYGLERVAMLRAAECAIYYSHTRPNGTSCFTAYPSSYAVAENIAAGYVTSAAVFDGWKEEDEDYSGQGHRRNMLSGDLNYVGIGCVKSGSTYYWAQAFSYSATGEAAQTFITPITVQVTLANLESQGLVDVAPSVTEIELNEGESADLPFVTANGGLWYHDTQITFSDLSWTSDSDLLTVADGKVTGVAGGKANLSATLNTDTVTVAVRVICAEHTWDNGVVSTKPTCTEAGEKLFTCAVCDSTRTETVEALGHDWGDWTIAIDTSTETASEERACRNDANHTETKILQGILLLPADLTIIESQAFANLSGRIAVRIPASVKSIAEDVFSGSDVILLVSDGSPWQAWAEERGITCIIE